jgi:hypothetical protein
MDDTTFEYDIAHLVEASRRFPAHRRVVRAAHPPADVSYLTSPNAEFGRHAWDEGGHL